MELSLRELPDYCDALLSGPDSRGRARTTSCSRAILPQVSLISSPIFHDTEKIVYTSETCKSTVPRQGREDVGEIISTKLGLS